MNKTLNIEVHKALSVIDKIVKTSEDELRKILEEFYINADQSINVMNELDESTYSMLSSQLDNIVESSIDSADIQTFVSVVETKLLADGFKSEFSPMMKQWLKDTVKDFSGAYITSIDKDLMFDHFAKSTVKFTNNWSKTLANLIQVDTHTAVKSILSKSLKNGKSVVWCKDELRNAYAFSETRSKRIALTEMLRAHSYAKNDAFLQSPSVVGVSWMHSGGKGINPRPHHVILDGVQIDMSENFTINAPSGTYECKFPRDITLPASEVVNCHCTHQPITDENITKLSKQDKIDLRKKALEELGEW